MKVKQALRIAWEGLTLNKVRSFLTTLGVIIGVAAVIVMLAVSAGAEAEVADQINTLGANLIMIMPSFQRAGPSVGGSSPSLTYDDLATIEANVTGISGVSAEQSTTQDVKAGTTTLTDISIIGTTPGFTSVREYALAEGRFLTDEDNDLTNKVAVLGADIAQELFGDPANGGSDPVGQSVKVGSTKLTVVGVMASKGVVGNTDYDSRVYVPITLVFQKWTYARFGGASYLLAQAAVALLTERSGATATEAAPLETEPTTVEPLFTTEPAAASESATEAEAAATSEPVVGSEPVLQDESAAQIEPTAQAEVTPASEADSTPEPITSTTASEAIHVVQAGDTVAAIARAYGVTVQAIVAANGLLDANVIVVGQELIIPDPAQVPAVTSTASGSIASSVDSIGTVTQRLPGLEQMPDTNPGPPFTVEVSANYAVQDPLVAKSRTYTVTGIVRNDGDETYAVSDIMVTFYDADGFRGTFSPAIRDGKLVGGEWHWHGEVQAEFAALLLAPGEEWPFSIQITAQDMASFLIHADAAPTGREPAQVELSGVRLVDEGTGYLRISGTATNASPFKAKNLTVSGVLLDANGQIVSLGSTYVLDEGIEPGASVAFDLRVEQTSYASYQLYAQAEHDW